MALHNAARQGFDSIALPHSTWQNGHVGRSFGDLESHVVRRNGTTLPREAAKIVRSLSDFGVTSQVRRFEPFNQDLTHIIITPELRSHLLHNGLTLWDSDNPRDMHRAIKAVEQAPERAPAPTSPEFSGFLSRHDGLPQRAKLSPESQRRVENPFRFNSIRVAQALERRGAGPMSAADFYRNAIGRGVSKEELAWGGLHPSQHDSLADRTPAEWRQHIERNLPIFHAQDQNGMNNGMLLNREVDNWVRDHGATDPVQHSIHNDVNDRYVYGKADMGPRLAGAGTAVSIGMTDLRHGGREANQIRHDSIQGHGEPHVLSYKAFGWHPKGINSPGEDHLIIDQLQSDWHQKKDLWNKYDPFFYNHEHPKFHDARMRVHENTLEEFPDYPFGRHGQWENVAIRHALYNAAMQGYDSLGLPPSESPYWHNGSLNYQNDYEPDYWSDNYAHLSNRYGIVVPQQVDRIVRELSDLGVHTFQRKFEPTGQMLTHIKITPELREHFMKHGMTLWESDNPRDMHRAIKAIKVRRGGVRTG
jgi:hypothetical protein